MTDSLGPQFLPGIDWNPYYPDSINRSNWAENITRTAPPKDTTENANFPLPGMEKVSQFYGDEQKNQQADVLDKLQKNVARHPLPEGFSLEHSSSNYQPDGSTKHTVVLTQPADPSKPNLDVGRLSWNGDTGRVAWFGIDQEHRGLASHVIMKAHEIAKEAGDVGPTHSEDLTGDSYKLAKKYGSAFIPSNTRIHGRTPEEQDRIMRDRWKSRGN